MHIDPFDPSYLCKLFFSRPFFFFSSLYKRTELARDSSDIRGVL